MRLLGAALFNPKTKESLHPEGYWMLGTIGDRVGTLVRHASRSAEDPEQWLSLLTYYADIELHVVRANKDPKRWVRDVRWELMEEFKGAPRRVRLQYGKRYAAAIEVRLVRLTATADPEHIRLARHWLKKFAAHGAPTWGEAAGDRLCLAVSCQPGWWHQENAHPEIRGFVDEMEQLIVDMRADFKRHVKAEATP
jgi:hypothetical protein